MADNDPQQELKKRARRRLVGALALALAAVIVLPMLMDREPRPAANELQIRIPSQEGSNFATRTITGTAPAPVGPSEPSSTSIAPVEGASLPTINEPVAEKKVVPPSAAQPKSAEERKTPIEEHKPPQTPKKPEPATKPSEETRAKAILEGKVESSREEKKREEKGGAFYIQLGVYRDAENAKDVQSKAAGLGVKCVLEKAGVATKVRVGPFADRVAAEQVAARLKDAGLPGFVAAK